jgi:hypothetical protein
LALSNSWSPVSSLTICAVTVVTLAKGLAVMLAESPAAITTIIVSPIARLTASRTPPTTPGRAAGRMTWRIVSLVVDPIASDPSRIDCGTALMLSSAIEDTNGMIITPITMPAAIALSPLALGMPIITAKSRSAGATVSAAK